MDNLFNRTLLFPLWTLFRPPADYPELVPSDQDCPMGFPLFTQAAHAEHYQLLAELDGYVLGKFNKPQALVDVLDEIEPRGYTLVVVDVAQKDRGNVFPLESVRRWAASKCKGETEPD